MTPAATSRPATQRDPHILKASKVYSCWDPRKSLLLNALYKEGDGYCTAHSISYTVHKKTSMKGNAHTHLSGTKASKASGYATHTNPSMSLLDSRNEWTHLLLVMYIISHNLDSSTLCIRVASLALKQTRSSSQRRVSSRMVHVVNWAASHH